MKTSSKLIGNLVHRVSIRLPYKSGRKIELVEQDPIVKQTVAAIIELSKYKLSIIANTLGYVLENISKTHQIYENNVPVEIMQSKLFVLRLLSACMQHHWQYYKTLEKENANENNTNESNSLLPPLDVAVVTFLIALMNRYLNQYHFIEESTNNEQNANNKPIVDYSEAEYSYSYEQIRLRLITDIYKAASNISYYISASNWDTCYNKIKNAVTNMDSIEKPPPEIRMLETSCLTKQRLSIVLKELSPYFLQMRIEGKLLFSEMMRKAIWKWIEEYPSEFLEVCTNDSRLMAGSEILFDMCSASADTYKRKAILWPLQTILLVLSPEFLMQAFFDAQTHNRKSEFFGLLKKSLQTTRNMDIAAICYIDLCKAASFVPPSNESILRSIAADVEADLIEKVWNFKKIIGSENSLATSGYVIDQQTVLTDFLLSQLRLHPEKTLKNIIPPCIQDTVPIIFKLSFVKACLLIVEDENHLSWSPTVSSMYNDLCTPLRKLFLQTISLDMGSISGAKKKETQSSHNSRVELLLDMIRLFKLDPKLAILGNDADRVGKNGAIMTGLMTLYQHSVPRIKQGVSDLLVIMHQSEIIANWGPDDCMIYNFWNISSPVILNLAQKLLDTKSNDDVLKSLLQLLNKLIRSRNVFLSSKKALLSSEYMNTRERLQASVALEIALLISMCSSNKDVCDEASQCIGLLCEEARLVDIREDREINPFTVACNIEIYMELSSEDSRFVGRKAQQKRIRKYLRMLPHHTPGNMTAWEEAWRRWKQLTIMMSKTSEDNNDDNFTDTNSINISTSSTLANSTSNISINSSSSLVNKKLSMPRGIDKSKIIGPNLTLIPSVPKIPVATESHENKAIEWQNFTGFLAALGGCCLVNIESSIDVEEVRDTFRVNTNTSKPIVMIDRFICDMIDMLVSDNVYISEGAKDTLGNDLSPALYIILFKHLETRMSKCFDSNNGAIRSPQNKMFLEQSVLVLRLILERLANPNDCLLNIDFSTLIYQFADYLNKVPNTYITLRIKVKMCLLIEILMQKKEQIVIRDEMRLRNKLLEICVEWTSDFVSLQKVEETGQKAERLQKDLDNSCLRAIVSLLHQLPLQPVEAVRPADISQIKSKLFLRYFGFFRKLLENFKQTERESFTYSVNNSINNHGSRDLTSRFIPAANPSQNEVYQDIAQMKELVIMAMSHLLSANVEAGLKYSLTMGYDEDQETRKAFMQVLTNILDQGTEFENLAENVMTDRYEKLIDMLVDNDMEIVMSLCEVCSSLDVSGIAEILLIAFESRDKVMSLLKAVIQREISLTEQEATLFRGTTIATRILSIFAKHTCVEYVRATLQPAMIEINKLPDDELTWELDPLKVESTECIVKNKKNVVRATEILLNAICASVDNAPRVFRQELAMISEAVGERFPESKYTSVGGFVFLRLFGPAILTPENASFSKQASPKNINVRKILLQATRAMQNLSNNVLFGTKETHMIILNDFLTSNIYKVTNFLRSMSTPSTDTIEEPVSGIRMEQSGYLRLHKYLSDNLERMSRNLTNRKSMKSNETDTQALLHRKKTLDRLSNLLAQLGRPSDIPDFESSYTRTYLNENNNYIYNEFIRRNSHRDVSIISSQNVFYMGGTSKAGRPVFYYICRVLDPDKVDFELMVYYMLRLMEPHLNSPFELLFDATDFNSGGAMPIHWITQFFQLAFNEMCDNLISIYLYNTNTYLQKYAQKLPRAITNKLAKRVHFLTSVTELSEFIAPSMIKLPKETLDLEKDATIVVSPVIRITNLRTSIPVTLKISAEYIQIITLKKQEFLHNISCILRDVHHISTLDDILSLPSSKPENGGELSIKYDKGKSTMVLSTPKRDVIISNFRANKRRYEENKPTSINEKAIRPNDVPGRLLNMALLNIGSGDPDLRLAAYGLLNSLSLSFKFNIGNQLLIAKDLCIPSNSSNFIVSISNSLAKSEIHLTLEFLNEAYIGFTKSSEPMCQLCLDYMVPWLKNLAAFIRYSPEEHRRNVFSTKDVLKLFIDMTIKRKELYKHVQTKIWKNIAEIDNIIDLVIDTFVQYSVEHGIGSARAEIIADTLVTMSSVKVRGKVISRMRRVIESTSAHPCRNLTEHQSWPEIAVLLRFILMLSFNNYDPVLAYIPEIFHIVSILVVTGPTFIRSSVHELVVNTIHGLCTMGTSIMDENTKKLQFLLNDLCDSKIRVSFGLTKQHANAFTINNETTTDFVETIDLSSLQNIIKFLMEALNFGAPSVDVANMWRARWMGLVTSTAFYFNPAIQPRAFVTLGCLAQDEVDDDLIYQIIVALKGALAIFNATDSNLIVSIIMCLTNIIENLPSDSGYLLSMFWLAVSLIQVGHPTIFQSAVQFLEAVLRALDARKYFVHESIEDVLLKARLDISDAANDLDAVCGVNFNNYFSFAISAIMLKGLKKCDNKDVVFQCLSAFLEIDCKRSTQRDLIDSRALGYFTGLLPFSSKKETLLEILHLTSLSEIELDALEFGSTHSGLFSVFDIPDNRTALLLISLLSNFLNSSENESERLFLYTILADAAKAVPEVFSLVYESLLPKMNQMVVNSQNHDVVEAVKSILITACSDPIFNSIDQVSMNSKKTQKLGLENLGFSSLCDPTYGAINTNSTINAKLASRLLGYITEQQ